jgi:hypothetical protein
MYWRIFVGDTGNGDIKNICLLLPDKIQEQIERPGKLAKLDSQFITRFSDDLCLFLF